MKFRFGVVWILCLFSVNFLCGCDKISTDDGDKKTASSFTIFRIEDGLSDNSVTGLKIDYIRNGVWFTTRSGLSFYSIADSTFKTYGAEYSIPDMEMTSLAFDYSGKVWVGTVTGLASMAVGDSAWTSLATPEKLIHRYITALAPTGFSIWIGTKGGVSVFGPDGWKSYTTELGASVEVTSLAQDSNGNMWVGSTDGIAVLSNGKWIYYGTSELTSAYINTVYADTGGTVWVGTSGVVAVYENGAWTKYGAADGLPSGGVNCFVRDKSGILWAGTNSGVFYLINGKWQNFSLPKEITGPSIRSIDSDQRNGTLWFGTDQGVLRYVPSTVAKLR
jgi:ligand-binding sensor domain-containing protein